MLAAMDRPKPFSMIREFHLADWFTLANAFCGVGSLFSVMSYLQTREVFHLYLACGLIPLALVFFVVCGVSRLARYNVTAEKLSEGGDKVKYFEGTPIPTSLLLVLLLAAAASQGALHGQLWFGAVKIAGFTLHPLVLLFVASGSLMVSRIHVPKL